MSPEVRWRTVRESPVLLRVSYGLVTFSPTTADLRHGRLTITDDAAASPQSVPLDGSGNPIPARTLVSASSTQPYSRTSDGNTWVDVDGSKLGLSILALHSAHAVLSASAALSASHAGYNPDLALVVSGGVYGAGQIVAWKRSSGQTASSSRVIAIHALLTLKKGTRYRLRLQWKADKPGPWTIAAGVAQSDHTVPPTQLNAEVVPIVSPIQVAGGVGVQTSAYTFTGSDGKTWSAMDASRLVLHVTPISDGTLHLLADADLFTARRGYAQDLGLFVTGGDFGAGQIVTSARNPGALDNAPNATSLQSLITVKQGIAYTITLQMKRFSLIVRLSAILVGGAFVVASALPAGSAGASSRSEIAASSRVLTINQAQQRVRLYMRAYGNPHLVIDEIMEFQHNFYAIVKDTSTCHGAFEVLVNKWSGLVFPEYGPAMMWNTVYGMMSGHATGGGMMGYGSSRGSMTISSVRAAGIARQWLARNRPGTTTETPDQFPGYYTMHLHKSGAIAGMLSVNGYSGRVWYHNWHGKFVHLQKVNG